MVVNESIIHLEEMAECTSEHVEKLLKESETLKAETVVVVDKTPSGESCGKHYELTLVVSEAFTGKNVLQRHRLINEALAEELKANIHALTVKKCLTPAQVLAAGELQASG